LSDNLIRKALVFAIISLFIGAGIIPSIPSEEPKEVTVQSKNDDGLVGYWNFNEGEGNVIRDYSGNGCHGENFGARWIDGIFGYGLEIEDDDMVGCISDSFDDSIDNQLTITCWLYWYGEHPDTYSQSSYIFDCREDSWDGGGFILYLSPEGLVQFRIREIGKSQDVTSSSVISIDTWVHVAVVFNFESETLKIYINGNEDNSSIAFNHYSDTNYDAVIGNNHWAPIDGEWCPLNGIIDELRIYNRALSKSEIQQLYENPGNLKPCVLIGRISSLDSGGGNLIFLEAEKLRVITFSPFQFLQYSYSEKITISEDYIGILNPNFVCAYCKADI